MDNISFATYADQLLQDAQLLRQIVLPEPLVWTIDWAALNGIQLSGKKRNWSEIPIFNELSKVKGNPAIYYFLIEAGAASELHLAYLKQTRESSLLRIHNGVKADGFINYSHVPPVLKETTCLYTGSVQHKVHQRLREHLGFSSGRTGALYLRQILSAFEKPPVINYHVHILPSSWGRIREHIECVVQDHLYPMIGKRAFRLFETDVEITDSKTS